jgi:hypothetical protein
MRAIRTIVGLVGAGTATALALAGMEPGLKRDADLTISGMGQIVYASGDAARLVAVTIPTDVLGLLVCGSCPVGLLGLATLLMLPKLREVFAFYWAMRAARDTARTIVREISDW